MDSMNYQKIGIVKFGIKGKFWGEFFFIFKIDFILLFYLSVFIVFTEVVTPHHLIYPFLQNIYIYIYTEYIYIYIQNIYIYIITVLVVTNSLRVFVANQMRYNLESAQYL